MGKRSALHIGEECLAIFGISIMFPKDSVYSERFNDFILRLAATGLIEKINTEMDWDLQRSSTGKLLQSSSSKTFKITEAEERKLNLADTEGWGKAFFFLFFFFETPFINPFCKFK